MIKQINEELSIKEELFSRQLSEEAGEFAKELRPMKVDEGAAQSMTFQERVWGVKSLSAADCTRQRLLDKHEGFIEQLSHLCQHWEPEELWWVYHQQQQKKLGEMLEETEKLRN